MAYYTALINAWNGGTQPPVGVTGTGLTGGMTTQQKLDAVNAWTVVGPAARMTVTPSQILNACVPADIASLTTAQVGLLTLILCGAQVDASAGTTVRLGIRNIFAGKTTTLANLTALADTFDTPPVKWWQANGYSSTVNASDLVAAGGLV